MVLYWLSVFLVWCFSHCLFFWLFKGKTVDLDDLCAFTVIAFLLSSIWPAVIILMIPVGFVMLLAKLFNVRIK